jgi:DNA-binding NtrC family response regulator
VADVLNNAKASILIVDDEPSVGDGLRLILESQGYEVVLVINGSEGIKQARTRRFGFIIVDLLLPDITGLQVIKEIHQEQPATPIVLVSGHGTQQMFAEAQRLGAVGALAKPFQPAEILSLITTALGQRS